MNPCASSKCFGALDEKATQAAKHPYLPVLGLCCKGYSSFCRKTYDEGMNILFVIIIIVAVVLAIVGGLVEAVNFLLWVGLILLILAVIGWLIRSLTGNRR